MAMSQATSTTSITLHPVCVSPTSSKCLATLSFPKNMTSQAPNFLQIICVSNRNSMSSTMTCRIKRKESSKTIQPIEQASMNPSIFMIQKTILLKSWVEHRRKRRNNSIDAPAYWYTLRRKKALLSKREVKEKATVPVIMTLLQVELWVQTIRMTMITLVEN